MTKINLKILDVFYGYECNLACTDCNPGSNIIQHRRLDPTLDSIIESIDNLAEHVESATNRITLLGGEPFLYWEERIVPIVRHLRAKFPTSTISVVTNGLLLHKFIDSVINLMLEVDNFKLSVSDHMREFSDDRVAINYYNNLNKFLSDSRLNKIHDFHYDIPNRKIDVHLESEAVLFIAQYKKINGQLKPFKTGDPDKSFRNGCCSSICSHLVNSKLYKCSKLAAIHDILKETDQLDDPDWAPYLNYVPIDLTQKDIDGELLKFEQNIGKSINVCDMCPDKRQIGITLIQQTKSNVLKTKG